MRKLMKYERAEKIDYNKLIYYFKDPHISPINFIKHKAQFHIFKEIIDGDKTLQQIEEDKKKFKSSLDQITSEDPEYKDDYQKM